MTLEQIIQQVAGEMGLPYDVCHKAYMSAWKFVNDKAQELPMDHNMSLEEFKRLRPNFNMPSLGKLYISEENFERTKKRFLCIEKFKKEHRNAESNQDSSVHGPHRDNG